ncbi:hypothetical protein GLOTRDRAFT_62527, partial [Gloeophyllum trabeum ATCC 11539]
MAPVNKAKAAGVSASSFLDLKAELAKHEEQSSKTKGPRNTPVFAGPSKKPSAWLKNNKGVKARAQKDVIELEAVSKPTLEKARAVLERKAKIYEQLRKGKSGGLSDKQYEALLVDFDQDAPNAYESDSDDVDESLSVPKAPQAEEDDPIVEYEDEFGRIRTARKSEVPRHLAPPEPGAIEEILGDDSDVIYNPVNHFPTYEPSAERITQIQESLADDANPLNIHYDASAEVRAKGAAFYQFSADEETRARQMDELRRAREETERVRREAGALDVRAGEVEGMRGGEHEDALGESKAVMKSRAMEKRKRELEERRRLVDAKRRKVKGGADGSADIASAPAAAPQFKMGGETHSSSPTPDGSDPLAAQKAQVRPAVPPAMGKEVTRSTVNTTPVNPADAFLAQLERDML